MQATQANRYTKGERNGGKTDSEGQNGTQVKTMAGRERMMMCMHTDGKRNSLRFRVICRSDIVRASGPCYARLYACARVFLHAKKLCLCLQGKQKQLYQREESGGRNKTIGTKLTYTAVCVWIDNPVSFPTFHARMGFLCFLAVLQAEYLGHGKLPWSKSLTVQN